MRNFVLRLIVNAVSLVVASELLDGIQIRDDRVTTLLIVALIFGLVNAIIKPILTVLTCPFIIVTLGLFILVLNGGMLLITDELAGNRFEVDGWWAAILGGIIMGVISLILESVLGIREDKDKHKEKRSPQQV